MRESVDLLIQPRERDIGGFSVRRVLPYAKRRLVGPFIFFDHMGPADFAPGTGIDVRPHPHIGLATVTYLFEGSMVHRDSLGCVQKIEPGAVNWMTAGRGIVHSERTGPEEREAGHRVHGIQSWVALPIEDEESTPSFHHHPADSLPVIERDGATLRLIAGTAFGERSPVNTFSEMFYLDVTMPTDGEVSVPTEHAERAVYVVDGSIDVAGSRLASAQMGVLGENEDVTLRAQTPTRLMLLGGAPIEGQRFIWWNFVSSSEARIEQAKADWKAGNFDAVPDETEFIPLPES